MRTEANARLSDIFKEMAVIYRYLGAEERFRSASYNRAAKVIGDLPEDVSFYAKNNALEDLPGIGKSMAEKIKEFLKTGTIKKYEQLKKETPHELIEMMDVKGFGPQSLKSISAQLKVATKKELIDALNDGQVGKLKGFGKKRVEGMLRGLKIHKTIEERMLLWEALNIGEKLVQLIKTIPGVLQVELAGSIRRRKETIGDFDLLIMAETKNRRAITMHFSKLPLAGRVLVSGDTKTSILLKDTHKQVDIRIVEKEEWGSALQYFTGSKEHNIHLRTLAKEKGYKISEYGIFRIKDNKRLGGNKEEEIYAALGCKIIPPEMREDNGEIELALKNKLPKLISEEAMKGDMHMHSNWSDGSHSIKEITDFVIKNLPYEYIVITDHSKSSRIAHGLDEKQFLEQIKEIDLINKKLGYNFVKKGIEVDILADGSLDISDDILAQLDWVVASIHAGFNKNNTKRLIKACENPYVSCIGHPTGRLIGTRDEYRVDFEDLFNAAKKTNTVIEINSQPQRMDLNDSHAMMAREKNVKMVIATDTHQLQDLYYMKLGVAIARRAWCTPSNILNTMPWKEIVAVKKKTKLSL